MERPEVTGRKAGIAACDAQGVFKPRARRINDACAALGVSRSHLYSLASEGKLRLVRIGNRTVVPESEIDRLLGGAI
ncbi:helix-turn-helix domain-containing protein [Methylocystis sp. H4A]|uniref:helix-turn-helix domain-containing protein n=1 Tax=Methylocystis sp. H4A TaxID=2785788 RepID=UPI0018C1D86C|nr:helix-turn-helix domain-containing protein [Methylocystis sp. H4A]MBG0801402.1 helix-turn-helix domain-containing protein [Methylocystis sp. H4A]